MTLLMIVQDDRNESIKMIANALRKQNYVVQILQINKDDRVRIEQGKLCISGNDHPNISEVVKAGERFLKSEDPVMRQAAELCSQLPNEIAKLVISLQRTSAISPRSQL